VGLGWTGMVRGVLFGTVLIYCEALHKLSRIDQLDGSVLSYNYNNWFIKLYVTITITRIKKRTYLLI